MSELSKRDTDGATRGEAVKNAEEMIDAGLKTTREAGWSGSEPRGQLAFA